MRKKYKEKLKATIDDILYDGFHDACIEIKESIDAISEQDLLIELKNKVKIWWDTVYPEDLFDGSSGNDGPLNVVEIRELIKKIESEGKNEN